MEKELTTATTTQEPMLAESLIVVQQLPVIKEQLHSIKAQAQASVTEALALVCTEETLKVVIANQAAGSASSTNFAFGPDADGRFSFFIRRSS